MCGWRVSKCLCVLLVWWVVHLCGSWASFKWWVWKIGKSKQQQQQQQQQEQLQQKQRLRLVELSRKRRKRGIHWWDYWGCVGGRGRDGKDEMNGQYEWKQAFTWPYIVWPFIHLHHPCAWGSLSVWLNKLQHSILREARRLFGLRWDHPVDVGCGCAEMWGGKWRKEWKKEWKK